MEKEKIKIGNTEVTGKGPLVIIGPNGAGKSRLGVTLTQQHRNSDRISAKLSYNTARTVFIQL